MEDEGRAREPAANILEAPTFYSKEKIDTGKDYLSRSRVENQKKYQNWGGLRRNPSAGGGLGGVFGGLGVGGGKGYCYGDPANLKKKKRLPRRGEAR